MWQDRGALLWEAYISLATSRLVISCYRVHNMWCYLPNADKGLVCLVVPFWMQGLSFTETSVNAYGDWMSTCSCTSWSDEEFTIFSQKEDSSAIYVLLKKTGAWFMPILLGTDLCHGWGVSQKQTAAWMNCNPMLSLACWTPFCLAAYAKYVVGNFHWQNRACKG